MKLDIRTTRPLTPQEIELIERLTDRQVTAISEDYKRNMPPMFPLSKSFSPNYEVGAESENDDNYDEEFAEMDKFGWILQEKIECIVHFFPC